MFICIKAQGQGRGNVQGYGGGTKEGIAWIKLEEVLAVHQSEHGGLTIWVGEYQFKVWDKKHIEQAMEKLKPFLEGRGIPKI